MALVAIRCLGFFVPQVLARLMRLRVSNQPGALPYLLPVGLAFYSLQNIAYLVDVYRGTMPATRAFASFGLYLAYFPKLLAGPIERPRPFLEKLERPRVVDNEALTRSVTLIAIGLVRKLLIADTLAAATPAHMWVVPTALAGPELLAWLVIDAFSLYNDFAGYSSMARGVSGLFGIELAPNFSTPFFARSFGEFWNRWHISLSHWLRDYVFSPLSRVLLRRFPNRHHWSQRWIPPWLQWPSVACGTVSPGTCSCGASSMVSTWSSSVSTCHGAQRARPPSGHGPASSPPGLACLPLSRWRGSPSGWQFRPAWSSGRRCWTGRGWRSSPGGSMLRWGSWCRPSRSTGSSSVNRTRPPSGAGHVWPRRGVWAVALSLVWIVTAGDPAPPFVYQGF